MFSAVTMTKKNVWNSCWSFLV